MTNCNPQQKPYHCVTHLHKHSKTGNRACIQTSYLTYTDTQNSPGLCLVMWNPLKTSLTFFPAPSLPLSYPGLDVVTVVWGFSELYSALRSCRDSWIMEIILMPRSLCQLNEMQHASKDAWATRPVSPDPHHLLRDTIQTLHSTPRQQQPFAWAQSIFTSVFTVLPHCLPPHVFTALGFSTFGVPISCSPPIYQQDEVAL